MAETVHGLLQLRDPRRGRIQERRIREAQDSYGESRVDSDHACDLVRGGAGILECSLHPLCDIGKRRQANVAARQFSGQLLEKFGRGQGAEGCLLLLR